LISAIFWAAQILIVGFLSVRVDAIQLAFAQFLICAILSFIVSFFTEIISLPDIINATVPILYAGLCSVGIAYTLQIVAQKTAHPANAAIIMSLESVFAVIGGWLVLSESIPFRGLFGCALMLCGMIISQLPVKSVTSRTT
jgi:drug/metabolite transporter (DMT)-like permease